MKRLLLIGAVVMVSLLVMPASCAGWSLSLSIGGIIRTAPLPPPEITPPPSESVPPTSLPTIAPPTVENDIQLPLEVPTEASQPAVSPLPNVPELQAQTQSTETSLQPSTLTTSPAQSELDTPIRENLASSPQTGSPGPVELPQPLALPYVDTPVETIDPAEKSEATTSGEQREKSDKVSAQHEPSKGGS